MSKRLRALSTIAIAIAFLLAGCTPSEQSGVYVIVGARLEPALDAEPIEYSVVVIQDGKFTAVGPQQTTPVPKGAETFSGKGMLIQPMPYDARIAPGEPANLMLRDADTRAPQAIMSQGRWIN